MADSELFETESGGEEVTLTVIDDGEPEVKEKPQRKKKELSPEAKARLLENLAKGRAKQAERRKKAQETKRLKQQLKDQEEEAELEVLRKKVKSKTKEETPSSVEVYKPTEGKEGTPTNNIIDNDLKKQLKEKDDELNKLKSYISQAQKKAQEWKEAQTLKQKQSATSAPVRKPPPKTATSPARKPAETKTIHQKPMVRAPTYKFNYSTGRMEWC